MSQTMSGESTLQTALEAVWHSRAAQALAMSAAMLASTVSCGTASNSELQTHQGSVAVTANHPSPTRELDPIHRVDFSDLALEPGVCQDTTMDWPTQLDKGAAAKKNGLLTASVSLLDREIAFGDLTGDGREEAVLPLVCDPGSEQLSYPIEVYTLKNGAPQRLGVVRPTQSLSDQNTKPTSIRIENEKIIVTKNHNGSSSSGQSTTTDTWHWDGSQLVAEGQVAPSQSTTTPKPTITTERPTTSTEVVPLNDKITIDNIAGLKLGMAGGGTGGLGFTSEPGCGSTWVFLGSHANISVTFDKYKLIDAIQVEDPFYKADKNIAVGSSEAELRAAYGNNLTTVQMQGNAGPFQVDIYTPEEIPPQDKGHQLLFSIIDGQVKFITLTKAGGKPILC